MSRPSRISGWVAAVVVVAGAGSGAWGAKPVPTTRLSVDESARRIGLFEAQEEGLVTIRVSPADEKQANVIITNSTDGPLTVDVPRNVAAVHMVRQPSQGAGDDLPSNTTRPNQAQTVAGQLFEIGPPRERAESTAVAAFTIPAQRAVRIQLQSVCLNHGKPTPSSRMTYRLMRLSDYTDDAALIRLFESVDLRRTDREVLQAAAWNIANGLSFEKLAAQGDPSGLPRPMFTTAQLASARQLVDDARRSAAGMR